MKLTTERHTKPLVKGIEHASKSVEIMEKISKAGNNNNNCVLAYRLQTLGDVYRDKEDFVESEKIYRRC